MASKNIVAKGTTYNGVESVTFPVSGGGDATFYEISDTTAAAADVASGKYFYTALGVLTQGTASGGGGGLVYETGTWTPSEDIANPSISFTDTHSSLPLFVMMYDTTNTYSDVLQSMYAFIYGNWEALGTVPIYRSSTVYRYGIVYQYLRANSTATLTYSITEIQYSGSNQSDASSSYPRYWITESGFKPYSGSDTRYWRAGRTYKWIAVWAPTI